MLESGAEFLLGPNLEERLAKGAFKAVHGLGSGTFIRVRTGQADTFNLMPDEAGQRYLRGQLKAGGAIWIVVVPDDQDVAATYFGAGSEPVGNRSRLVIEVGAAK
jgi:hypothetical protein